MAAPDPTDRQDPMAPAFRALADPSRRLLLDRLFERDGQTLGELCAHLPGMTRFGVMRHLGVLESAGLVGTRRAGREKRHFLNPVPIRLVHDRWIGKFAEPVVGVMSNLKRHLEGSTVSTIEHIYSVYLKASRERVWRAITDGVETERYYYGTRVGSEWTNGARITYEYPDGSVAADGEVLEFDPPNRLAMTFHAHWDPEIEAHGPVTMTWELEAAGPEMTKLTVVTGGVQRGSKLETDFAGGIVYIVSGLKTYLETGASMAAGAA